MSEQAVQPVSEPGSRDVAVSLAGWALLGICGIALVVGVSTSTVSWSPEILAWVAAALVVNIGVVKWERVTISLDLPILLAIAFLFGPVPGCAVALITLEPQGIADRLPVSLLALNQAQAGIAVLAAGYAFQLVGGLGSLRAIAAGAFAGLVVDFAINATVVAWACSRRAGDTFVAAFSAMMRGRSYSFHVAYFAYGLTSIGLVVGGVWAGAAAAVLAVPVALIAGLCFRQAHGLDLADQAISERDSALDQVPHQLLRERLDERMLIAASLHDDVIQNLHFLTLQAQVVREDLRSGRLLELEEDVPALLKASQETAELTRAVVSELRQSSIGRGGIEVSLRTHCERLRDQFPGEVELSVSRELNAISDYAQLFLYQVAREASVNSVKHARAGRIQIKGWREGGMARIEVTDDGTGFQQHESGRHGHFGLMMLNDRARTAGGKVEISSKPGDGTRVTGSIPVSEA